MTIGYQKPNGVFWAGCTMLFFRFDIFWHIYLRNLTSFENKITNFFLMKKNLVRLPLNQFIPWPTHLSGHIFWNFSSLLKHFWACYIHKNIKKYEKYTFFGEFDSLCNEPPLDFFQLCCSNNEVWRLVDQLDQKVELIKPGF